MPAKTTQRAGMEETCHGAADFSRATDACAEVQPNEDGCCAVRVWSPSTGASVQVVLSQEQIWQMMRSYFQVYSQPQWPATGSAGNPQPTASQRQGNWFRADGRLSTTRTGKPGWQRRRDASPHTRGTYAKTQS